MVYKKIRRGAVKADVIILGCSLPGIVTAYKLKERFGDTMDIVMLDVGATSKMMSRGNVAFHTTTNKEAEDEDDDEEIEKDERKEICENEINDRHRRSAISLPDLTIKRYLVQYCEELGIPIPDAILNPELTRNQLNKIFQYENGDSVPCADAFFDFNYLNCFERFELNQYKTYIDSCVECLFRADEYSTKCYKTLQRYDKITMEKNICDCLLFSTPRNIMRLTVELVCGVPANAVSFLFYLYQCYRTGGIENHLEKHNSRFQEKLIGYCEKHLSHILQAHVDDITMPTKSIKHIRAISHEDAESELVMLESLSTTYICNLLAMALNPDQLTKIEVADKLLPEKYTMIIRRLTPGKAIKFLIQYEDNFWTKQGFSGEILSLRGPVMWAMERPNLSFTGSVEKYHALIGYVMIKGDEMDTSTSSSMFDNEVLSNSRDAVVEQLVELFGSVAAYPVSYRERSIANVFIPACGDYLDLRLLTNEVSPRGLEWSAFDVYADGDVAAALEAGHTSYLHLLGCLRPQAQTFEEFCTINRETTLLEWSWTWWLSHINYISTSKMAVYTGLLFISIKIVRSYIRNMMTT